MDKQRRIVLTLGAGLVGILGATVALAGAHDASMLRTGKVVREVADSNYFYTVREAPLKPDEPYRQDGTFPSGYYYVCAVTKGGLPVSSYTLLPDSKFKADSIKINRLNLQHRSGLMSVFDIEGNTETSYEVVCRALDPARDDPNPNFSWQVVTASGK